MGATSKYSAIIWDSSIQQWVRIGSNYAAEVLYGTKAEWNEKLYLISKKSTIYVYTDYKIIPPEEEGGVPTYVQGIKIGDGKAYLIDLPFIAGDYETLEKNLTEHVSNTSIHVTSEEKAFWNNKSRILVEGQTLVCNY